MTIILNRSLSGQRKVTREPFHCVLVGVALLLLLLLLGRDRPPPVPSTHLSVYRALRVATTLARPSTSLCVFRPASRRPHRRHTVTVTVTRQPLTHPVAIAPRRVHQPPNRTVFTRPLRACATTSTRSRHHRHCCLGPGPGPGPRQHRPLLTMSRPADGLPSQAGLGDNNASHPTANPLFPRDTTAPRSAPRPQDQDHFDPHPSRPSQKRSSSNSDSQATNLSSDESTRVFSPPMIETAASDGAPGSGQGSSQESQLFQLSQLAAAQDKLPGQAQPVRSAVKRTADGTVKDPRFSPTASPDRTASHSRNTSAVSAASTASSRVTEVCSDHDISSPCSRHSHAPVSSY